jgi:hypothetical protein
MIVPGCVEKTAIRWERKIASSTLWVTTLPSSGFAPDLRELDLHELPRLRVEDEGFVHEQDSVDRKGLAIPAAASRLTTMR